MQRLGGLSHSQQELVRTWLPAAEVTADHSWGLVGTTVLELWDEGERYIVKAGDEHDHHIAREIRAHNWWLQPWTSIGRAPALLNADCDAKLVVTRHLPGRLVEGTAYEHRADTYRQAGELLAGLHEQERVEDAEFEAREQEKALRWLAKPHRIEPRVAAQLRSIVESWPTPPSVLVPTHGDWQPRNWLVHDGTVSVIDFGRADLRPAFTDLARLSAQQFGADSSLEVAFLSGYGEDPREQAAWQRHRVREAIGTAVWSYQVRDEPFEQQGHRMIAEALADECQS